MEKMTQKSNKIRVRFAPSPTGALHIGGLRTALYNFLFARQKGGVFILRIEDTDRERYVADAEQYIKDSLTWCGMTYDEGPDQNGPFFPYHQSQRQDIYRAHIQELIDNGYAYYAFDTRDELDQMRTRLATKENPSPRYDGTVRNDMVNSFTLSDEEVQGRLERGDPYVVRMRVPEDETIEFVDLIRGTVRFESKEIDDQILLKSDGMPTYHLANVVDDHHMGISHVVRGEEWLPSTPKHILLYQFFGWDPPELAHLPLILSPTGGKLSKRRADKMGIPINVLEYREAGYEPEALVNFLAFLGWNPGTDEEMFSLEELVSSFSIERIGSSGVQFDIEKLNWYNQQHLRRMDLSELSRRTLPYFVEAGIDVDEGYLESVLTLMRERLTLAKDLLSEGLLFFRDPMEYDEKGVKKRWKSDTGELLRLYTDSVNEADAFDAPTLEILLKETAETHAVGLGKIMAPLRIALSGRTHGPDLYQTMEILGKETTIRRIQKAVESLP